MFGFVKGFGRSKPNPIGVDFGSDQLKMAQVAFVNGEPRLIAAAAADVPSHVRHNPAARLAFFSETVRDLLAHGKFRGRQAILALPAASMFIQHLRIAKMDDELLKKALPWEARGKLPIDPSQALIRHLVAGEVYQDQEPRNEVILMAAARESVNQFLAAAAKAKLDVVGMSVEPAALVGCFGHIYRRKDDATAVSLFVDIGCGSSRAVIAQGSHILFARSIKVGGEHMTRAVASAMKINVDNAKLLRMKLCHLQPSLDEHRQKQEIQPILPLDAAEASPAPARTGNQRNAGYAAGEEGGGTALMEAPAARAATEDLREQLRRVDLACREPLGQLIEELHLCRRYYESTFPNKPVDRLVFVGGEAKQRGLCQEIARDMALPAQVGDPLVRLGRTAEVGIESGLDRREPQPGWAVAIGLSLGPIGAAEESSGSTTAAA